MNICDIFFSLQGESTFAGLPCIFIRLAECNLRCSYCDTPESYGTISQYSIDRILEEIKQYGCKLVEITGGEPLLQPETIELMEKLNSAGYIILLETNGSLSIQQVPSFVHVIIDVKLPGSDQPDSFDMANLQWLKEGWDEIKFVITNRADFEAAINFINTNKLTNHILLFSPVTGKLKPTILTDWIKVTGLPIRLNLQLQKLLKIK